MLTSYTSLVLKDPLAGKRLRAIPPERADEPAGYGKLADFSSVHLLQLDACTKCGKCHEACPANAVGRPLSPRDVILELREQANATMKDVGVGGVLGTLLGGRRGAQRVARRGDRRRGSRSRRHDLVVHAVQRLRRGVPGRHRAGADHQSDPPKPRRRGRAGRQPAVHPAGDPQVGQLVRREQAQARPLDARAGLRDQGRALRARRRAVVRRRLRLVRPALAAGHTRAGSALPARGRRLRDPLRRRAQLRQRRAPGGGGRTLRVARGGERRHAQRLRVQTYRHQRPAFPEHAAQRVRAPTAETGRSPTTRRSSRS